MFDIRAWLTRHDLDQYADAFEENGVDQGLLAELTNEDLKDLGVARLADRKTILKIIASEDDNGGNDGQSASAGSPNIVAGKAVGGDAQRRQITVMFCDLVGSTALSVQLDPEVLHNVMTLYRMATEAVVARFDGHVAQYLGDGVMVYFGWPTAHEDDAARAVRAGLEIIKSVQSLEAEAPLSVRIGIATGLVVVGAGNDQGDARLAIGETPNIAARVQALAEPHTVAIAQSTRALLGNAFDLDDLGAHQAKGVSGRLQAYRVMNEASSESRFHAAAGSGHLTQFVGRNSEISLLMDRWGQARDGEGQVVVLSGEPGIGKSRITEMLNESLSDAPHTRLRYQCSPYYTNSAFYPLITGFEHAAGFEHDETTEQKLDKLEALLALGTDKVGDIAALMALMMSLRTDRYPALDLSPQKQKEMTIAALVEQVRGLAGRQPVLMILEDAHWIDPTTLEVFGSVIDRLQGLPVLLVITCRPEFEPPWSGYGHLTVLSLPRLSRRLGLTMVDNVTGGKALPDEVLDQIIAKTDGVPLFVEELTKMVLEAGILEEQDGRYVLTGPLPPLAIPATLQDSLMARLDRLSPVRELAQIGACIGREFPHDLLAAISALPDNDLEDAILSFVDSDLIFRQGTPPEAVYTFKHALVQDAAYDSILKSRRVRLHRQIGVWLEANRAGTQAAAAERLAEHYAAAEMPLEAVTNWFVAAEDAQSRDAIREAISHLQAGIEASCRLPDPAECVTWEIKCQLAIAPLYLGVYGWASADAHAAYRRARALGEQAGDKLAIAMGRRGDSMGLIWRGDIVSGRAVMFELQESVENDPDPVMQLIGKEAKATALVFSGDWREARQEALDAMVLFDRIADSGVPEDAGLFSAIWARVALCYSNWMLGYPEQARSAAEKAIDLARTGTVGDKMWVLTHAGADLHFIMRDVAAAAEYASEARSIHARHPRFDSLDAMCDFHIGNSESWSNHDAGGIDRMRAALTRYGEGGIAVRISALTAAIAEAEGHFGCVEEGLATLAASPDRQGENARPARFAEIWRIEGELYATCDPPDLARAETCLLEAIEIARAEEAKAWELRAATSLARLWQGQGRTREAQEILEPVYNWFTEGFDTPDLKGAKVLLAELT